MKESLMFRTPESSQDANHPLLTKREFLKLCGSGFCALLGAHLFPITLHAQTAVKGLITRRPSPYFSQLGTDAIRCELCPRRCRIPEGKRGLCRVRENRGGKGYSLVYGNPCIIQLEPVEREPFFHLLPGSTALALSTAGCNLQCKFCENWEISQASPEDVYSYAFSPDMVVKKAGEMRASSIAFTYAEPTVFFEYMLEIAALSKKRGLLNVIHSNGFINGEPLRDLCKILDAAQIDLKGFTETCYSELSDGQLGPVLKTLKSLRQKGIHIEVTCPLIPTKNDGMSSIQEMCHWVKRELGPEIPIHFSRFYPLHQLKRLPPTPVSTLEKAREVALSTGLQYVYIGRVPGHEGWNTFCPSCKKIIIHRTGYMITEMHLKGGKCAYCGRPIPGIWGLK